MVLNFVACRTPIPTAVSTVSKVKVTKEAPPATTARVSFLLPEAVDCEWMILLTLTI